jgi:tripartite-type tricarboxylate transporter receptor subunit TctC
MKKHHSNGPITHAITALTALKKSMRIGFWLSAAPFLVAVLPGHAADPFPSKPIQLVIPFAPGDTDNMIRPFADRMGEFLGQPVVLSFRPGAGGAIGAGTVASSKPDGLTLVGTSPGSIVVVPLANKDIKYSFDSFEPIASLSEGGMMLVVSKNAPWKTLKELVDYSKANPGVINYTTSGAMGITHLLAEIFSKEAGIKWTHIPEKGSGPAVTSLLGGHVQLSSAAVGAVQTHVESGALRPLAVFSLQRLKSLPDVPTLRELGYKIAGPAYYGISAPKGTPKEVIDQIYLATQKTIEKYNPQIAGNLKLFGAEIKHLNPAEYKQYLRDQNALFADAMKGLN